MIKNKTVRKTKGARLFGVLSSLFFAIYNGAVGFFVGSIWHISMGIYYFLLLAVKAIVYSASSRGERMSDEKKRRVYKNAFNFSAGVLIVLNLALAAPIILMVMQGRTVKFSLTIAIGIAAYTTYRVTMSIVNFVRYRNTSDLMARELLTVGLIESIMAVLTLQNTLITVNGGEGDQGLFALTVIVSVAGFLGVLTLIILMIKKAKSSKP
jgi:uncharacterized membrane protein YeiB